MLFSELGLSEKVLRAVEVSGYTTPTPIQAEAIPLALAGRDVLGIAQTGTGKTAAFTLPMLSRLEQGRARARMPRTLILEPTRELAAQVEESFNKYGSQHKLNVALLIGGVSFADQETKIMRGADVLIATPGRLLDFFERGKLLLNGIEILVIDEADRMLDMGFIPDIEKICKLVPFTRQTLFFSATMPPEITRLTEQFLHNPVRVEVARAATTASTITQALVASHGGGDKRETLRRLLRGAENLKNAIVFCNRKRDVAIVYNSLQKHGFPVGALHGDMDQPARMASLDAFKNGAVDILVCSDVAARGLDIPDVSHVINFDVPTHSEDYVHRIGRTGRAGRSGHAYTIVTSSEFQIYFPDRGSDQKADRVGWRAPRRSRPGRIYRAGPRARLPVRRQVAARRRSQRAFGAGAVGRPSGTRARQRPRAPERERQRRRRSRPARGACPAAAPVGPRKGRRAAREQGCCVASEGRRPAREGRRAAPQERRTSRGRRRARDRHGRPRAELFAAAGEGQERKDSGVTFAGICASRSRFSPSQSGNSTAAPLRSSPLL